MTHIQQRRDQAAVWTSTNPVLYEGEAGHEEDTGKWKLGDGVTAWNALPYKGGVDSVAGKTGVVTLVVADVSGAAPTVSPAFTGSPTAPTPATTAFVKDVLAGSPVLGGNPTAPTPSLSDDDTSIATTAFVKDAIAAAVLDTLFPVNALYFTATNINPGTFLGGTWVAFGSGRVLVGVDATQPEFDTAGETGGVKEVTLTAEESGMPLTDTVRQLDLGPVWINNPSDDPDGTHRGEYVGPLDAAEAHTNLQPYITGYMWKRTV